MSVQAAAEVIVAELQLDRIAVNDAWIENYGKDPHRCQQVRLRLSHSSFVLDALQAAKILTTSHPTNTWLKAVRSSE